MLLTIDCGNTETVFGLFQDKVLIHHWRMATNPNRTSDEYAAQLLSLLQHYRIALDKIKHVIIASVVPATSFPLKCFAKDYLNCNPIFIGSQEAPIAVELRVDEPDTVGADRIVNTIAAHHRYQGHLLVIDFGTATTFDLINDQGAFLGGVIAPGLRLSAKALQMHTAKLPAIDIQKPEKAIGTNTEACIQSGLFWGYIGLVEGISEKIKQEYAHPLTIIATGGLANLLEPSTNLFHHLDQDLTLYGLMIIFYEYLHK